MCAIQHLSLKFKKSGQMPEASRPQNLGIPLRGGVQQFSGRICPNTTCAFPLGKNKSPTQSAKIERPKCQKGGLGQVRAWKNMHCGFLQDD